MAVLLFLLPILAYLLWWELSGRPAITPSRGLLVGLAALVFGGFGLAVWYGLSGAIEPGQRYAPAVLQGGEVMGGRGVAAPPAR
jgi:hypothetical protein